MNLSETYSTNGPAFPAELQDHIKDVATLEASKDDPLLKDIARGFDKAYSAIRTLQRKRK